MIEDILDDLVDEGLVEEVLPDIILSHTRKSDPNRNYVTPEQNVKFWYVFGEPSGDDFLGYKEGICLHIRTDTRDYDITISTEALLDMTKQVVSRIAGTPIAIQFIGDTEELEEVD